MKTEFSTIREAISYFTCSNCGAEYEDLQVNSIVTTDETCFLSFNNWCSGDRQYVVDLDHIEDSDYGGRETLSEFVQCNRCMNEWNHKTYKVVVQADDVRLILSLLDKQEGTLKELSELKELATRLTSAFPHVDDEGENDEDQR